MGTQTLDDLSGHTVIKRIFECGRGMQKSQLTEGCDVGKNRLAIDSFEDGRGP